MEAEDWEAIGDKIVAERGIRKGQDEYTRIKDAVESIWTQLSTYIDGQHKDKATPEEWCKFIEDKVINVDDATYAEYVNEVVKGIISILDVNNSGAIDAWEYILFMKCVGVKDGPAHDAFTILDHNGNGSLDEQELIKGVHDFFRSDDWDSKGNALFGPLESFYHF